MSTAEVQDHEFVSVLNSGTQGSWFGIHTVCSSVEGAAQSGGERSSVNVPERIVVTDGADCWECRVNTSVDEVFKSKGPPIHVYWASVMSALAMKQHPGCSELAVTIKPPRGTTDISQGLRISWNFKAAGLDIHPQFTAPLAPLSREETKEALAGMLRLAQKTKQGHDRRLGDLRECYGGLRRLREETEVSQRTMKDTFENICKVSFAADVSINLNQFKDKVKLLQAELDHEASRADDDVDDNGSSVGREDLNPEDDDEDAINDPSEKSAESAGTMLCTSESQGPIIDLRGLKPRKRKA